MRKNYTFAVDYSGTYRETARFQSMKHIDNKIVIYFLCGALFLGACNKSQAPSVLEHGSERQTYPLVLQDNEAPGENLAEKIQELSVYHFSNGKFYLKQQLKPNEKGEIAVSAAGGSRLYFISGIPFSLSGETIDEENFRNIAVGRDLHDNSAPEFMTAVVDLGNDTETRGGGDPRIVSLKRSVARLDIDASTDSKIRISEVLVENAPAEICPFREGQQASKETISYRKVFETAVGGKLESVFRIFESAQPVHLVLLGSYDDAPLRLKLELPTVECNKVYAVEVRNSGAMIEGVVEVKPWDEGGTVVGSPDAGNRIVLDAARSRFPAGVKVDYQNNLIEVPAEGAAGMKLAFLGDSRIDIDSVEGLDPDVTLSGVSVSEEPDGGFVSMFDASVAAQGRGRLGYSVLVHLKSALTQLSYDYVEIRVAPSEHQIETVEMGGLTWMAFNARTHDLEDQVYPLDGLTVEEMYRESWINTIGGLFQFGRLYMYVPWQGYNPSNNLGNQTQDAPWIHDTHMPCPEGYRVPTRAEWRAILPASAQIPGNYTTATGEQITATLHVANGTLVTPTGVTGTQRYVKLSVDGTDRFLIFPMAGYKGDKSTSNNPNFGNWALMWTNDRTGCPGGYAWLRRLSFSAATNSLSLIDEYQWQMEGFAYVRCVKK